MSEIKPYYDKDGITIYCGDGREILPRLPANAVDISITSPPYNMGLIPGGNGRGMYRPGANNKAGRFREGYGKHSDALPQGEYDDWQRKALAEMWRISRLAVFYNHRPRVEHGRLRVPLSLDYGDLPLRQIITWNRFTGIGVNLRHFCSRYEWILLFAKPEFRLVSHSVSGWGDVWSLGIAREKHGHPAPFPVELPARCIEAVGALSVLDPFAGVGTTLLAAKMAGARAIGIELEERFCDKAIERLEAAPAPPLPVISEESFTV